MSLIQLSGQPLPVITLPTIGGGKITLGQAQSQDDWHVVVVYRGLHCRSARSICPNLKRSKASSPTSMPT